MHAELYHIFACKRCRSAENRCYSLIELLPLTVKHLAQMCAMARYLFQILADPYLSCDLKSLGATYSGYSNAANARSG